MDRASIFDFEQNKGFTLRYSVVDPEINGEPAPAYLSTQQVPWGLPQLLRGETIFVSEVADFPQFAFER